MLRGEFIRADGLVIPNNVTKVGAATILALALQNTNVTFFVGLTSAVYAVDLQVEDLVEPSIGVNGYARQAIARDAVDWENDGELNGEPYVETKEFVWVAVGGDFDEPISRLFICFTLSDLTGDVFALSASLPEEITIGTDTDVSDRTFRYRIYLR